MSLGNTIATQVTGIVAGVEVNIRFLACQIVNAIRDQFALASIGKVMVQRLRGFLRIPLAFPGEVANQLFSWCLC